MTKYVVEIANCVELIKKNYDAFAACEVSQGFVVITVVLRRFGFSL